MISDTDYTVSGVSIHNFRAQRYYVFDFEATGINHETERSRDYLDELLV